MSDSRFLTALVGVEDVPYSADKLFGYAVPGSFSGLVKPGVRVLAPFGRGNMLRQGFVYSVSETAETDTLKSISSVLDSEPVLSEELIKVALYLQSRCFCTYYNAAKSVLPGGFCFRVEKSYCVSPDFDADCPGTLDETQQQIFSYLLKQKKNVTESSLMNKLGLPDNSQIKRLVKSGLVKEESSAKRQTGELSEGLVRLISGFEYDSMLPVLTEKQRKVAECLAGLGSETVAGAAYYAGVSETLVRTMIKKGYLEYFGQPLSRSPTLNRFSDDKSHPYNKPVLSELQNNAYREMVNEYTCENKRPVLLYGVTGSGKTSVYLELIDKVISDNKTVIVLVPEISLTPQSFDIFTRRYGPDVAILHSRLSPGERYDEYMRVKRGEAKIVVGTRSAVFAPVKNLGLIVIDEEQEHTYKSEMTPRYSARDIAGFRCSLNSALLVLASATPSVESYANAVSGKYLLCPLPARFGKAKLPTVFTSDMSCQPVISGANHIGDELFAALEKTLADKNQAILLVNRRGFNTFVSCPDCKNVVSCPNCSISMTYHRANDRLMCHYCGYSIPFTTACPSCSGSNLRYSGYGTQKIEDELAFRLPAARVVRMDADTTATKNSHETVLTAFANGEYDILVGTQMVAKGLDFPRVSLVGVINADKELYNDDFRSSEKAFDLFTQVVGRAGRCGSEGTAIIQTVTPDNPIIRLAAVQDYDAFFKNEIILRKALVYPPYCDICEIGVSGADRILTAEAAAAFLKSLTQLHSTQYPGIRLIALGPVMPRVSKINNLYRMNIILKTRRSSDFYEMISALLREYLAKKEYKDLNFYADINPRR